MCDLSKPQNTTCITPSKGNGTGGLHPPHRDRPVLAQRPEHSSCTLVISLSQQLWAVLWSRHTSLLRPRCCSEPLRRCALCPRCLSNKSFPMPAVSKTLITRLLTQGLLPKKSNQQTWQRPSSKYLNFTNHIHTVTAAQNGHIGCDLNDTPQQRNTPMCET